MIFHFTRWQSIFVKFPLTLFAIASSKVEAVKDTDLIV